MAALDPAQRMAFSRLKETVEMPDEEALDEVIRTRMRCFEIVYRGGTPVAAGMMGEKLWDMIGDKIIDQTIKKLKKQRVKEQSCYLTISRSGFEIDTGTETLAFESLSSIKFARSEKKELKKMYYVCFYPRLGLLYCHLIAVKDKSDLTRLQTAIDELTTWSREDVRLRLQGFGFANNDDEAAAARAKQLQEATGQVMGVGEVLHLLSAPVSMDELQSAMSDDGNDTVQVLVNAQLMDVKSDPTSPRRGRPMSIRRRSSSSSIVKALTTAAKHVVLLISSEAVRVIDNRSREEFIRHFLPTVHLHTMVTLDGKKAKSGVAIIASDSHIDAVTLHVFRADSPDAAQELYDKIDKAVMIKRRIDQIEGDTPFLAMARYQGKIDGKLSQLEVPRDKVKPLKAIGSGQFGIVFRAQYFRDDGEVDTCAVKMLRKGTPQEDFLSFLREAETMTELNHPNIVKLTAVCLQEQPWLLVQELLIYGDFDNVLRLARLRGITLSTAEGLHFVQQILAACEYIVKQGFLHGDLAARNVLLGENNLIKLADFGTCHRLPAGKKVITLDEPPKVAARWLALESINHLKFSEASDVWASAIASWEIFSMGEKPYKDIHFLQIMRFVNQGERPAKPDLCPDELYALWRKCWEAKPEKRPSFKDLIAKVGKIAKKFGGDPMERDVGKAIKGKVRAVVRDSTDSTT
eukprot:TRINITY_DN10020_c0_g1_i2.p1 TRINITY_DN10020_c0_g1~~TRINITY_DN10020_c0_g1_i2.p1  ORF type:complete len:690 (+),score=216.33 TRINITY_DN10020_c0_g1_i2:37-2106(+)